MHTIKHVGYLGPKGTFSEQAAKEVFKNSDSFDFHRYDTIHDCLMAATNQTIDYAVVPIENSIGGSVNITVDHLFHDINLPIQGEIHLPISYELLGNAPQANTGACDIIYGHPQALKQCNNYLREHYNDVVLQPTDSSGAAAQIVSENPGQAALAVANTEIKHIYDLVAIADEIENNTANTTRFIVLGDDTIDLPCDIMKSTLIIALPDNDLKGLQNVLKVFETLALSPLKIESVPLKRRLGEYGFIIDVDTTNQHTVYNQACNNIRALNCTLQHLGTYGVCRSPKLGQ